jgi:phage portal protein BeeE
MPRSEEIAKAMAEMDRFNQQPRATVIEERYEKRVASVGGSYGGLAELMSQGRPGNWASDHKAEAEKYSGWHYVAISAIGKAIRSCDVEAYQEPVREYSKAYNAEDDDSAPLPKWHPLMKILKRPSASQSGASFREEVAIQLCLTGSALIWNVPNQMGRTVERYIIPTAIAEPRQPEKGLPKGGWYINPEVARWQVENGWFLYTGLAQAIGKVIDARDVQVIRFIHPTFKDEGQSPVSAGALWTDTSEKIDVSRHAHLRNGSDPSVIIGIDGVEDESTLQRMSAKFNEKYAGPSKHGKAMFVNGQNVKVEPVTRTPAEMGYEGAFAQFRDAIMALHGVTPIAAGIEAPSGDDGLYAPLKQFIAGTVQPILDLMAEEDTEQLASQFGEGLTVFYTARSIDDAKLTEQQINTDIAAGAIEVDEIRKLRGRKPWGGEKGKAVAGQGPKQEGPGGLPGLNQGVPGLDAPKPPAGPQASVPGQPAQPAKTPEQIAEEAVAKALAAFEDRISVLLKSGSDCGANGPGGGGFQAGNDCGGKRGGKWSEMAGGAGAIAEAENQIRGSKSEVAVIFNPDGKELFRVNGIENKVKFTDQEYSKFSGKIITHNHPSDSGQLGTTFSDQDLALAINANLKELRLVGLDGSTHSIKPSGESWPDLDDVNSALKKERAKLKKEIKAGKRSMFDNVTRISLENVSARLGISYTQESNRKAKSLSKSADGCGANAQGGGGFQPGNTCGKRDGSEGESQGGDARKVNAKVLAWAKEKFGDEKVAENFVRWFGDSKVVDDDGNPQIVYHGTTGKFENVFDPAKGELGNHFGTQEVADGFASRFNESGKGNRVYPAFLSIKNPLKMVDKGQWDNLQVLETLVANGKMTQKEADDWQSGFQERWSAHNWKSGPYPRQQETVNLLSSHGYDGIEYINRREGIKLPKDLSENTSRLNGLSDNEFLERVPNATTSYISIYPNQIKSATGNSGTFDPDNPNITKSAPSEGYRPPVSAQSNARKVLRWKREHGDAVQGMTATGWARARQLASGKKVSRETVGRMAAFARHRKNSKVNPKFRAEPWRDAGYVAWLGWGGDSGINWAAGIVAGEGKSGSDCGANQPGGGGFRAGNTCGKEDGGSGDSGSSKVRQWAEKKFKDKQTAENFAKWFGDSKFVDENGEPIAVYHGTSTGFTEFRNTGARLPSIGYGFYFSPDADVASTYATGETPQVMQVYLQADKVLDWDNLSKSDREAVENRLVGIVPDDRLAGFGSPQQRAFSREQDDEAEAFYRKKKKETAHLYHDRAKARVDFTEDGTVISWMEPGLGSATDSNLRTLAQEYDMQIGESLGYDAVRSGLEIVVFRPNQIKSATGNSGAFSPDSRDITKSSGCGANAQGGGGFQPGNTCAREDGGGDESGDDYRGNHRAPGRDSGAPLHDVTGNGEYYPDDIYGPKAVRLYNTGSGNKEMDAKSIKIIQSLRGKPDAEVTIYRAVPKDTDGKINPGDWVTINRDYAVTHGEGPLRGEYRIMELKVRASDVFTSADSIHEYGYDPAERSKSGSDCGANAEGGGGFQPGNSCARGDGSKSGAGVIINAKDAATAIAKEVIKWAEKMKQQDRLAGEMPTEEEVKQNWMKLFRSRKLNEGDKTAFAELNPELESSIRDAVQQNSSNPAFQEFVKIHGESPVIYRRQEKGRSPAAEYRGVIHVFDSPFWKGEGTDELKPGKATAGGMGGYAAVIRHEYGHKLYGGLTVDQQREWSGLVSAVKDVGKGLTSYATKNPEETFCELFAVTTDKRFNPSSFPDWVNQLRIKQREWLL